MRTLSYLYNAVSIVTLPFSVVLLQQIHYYAIWLLRYYGNATNSLLRNMNYYVTIETPSKTWHVTICTDADTHICVFNILTSLRVERSRTRLLGRRYSPYSFLTSALDGVSGQRHASAVLYPGEKTPGTASRISYLYNCPGRRKVTEAVFLYCRHSFENNGCISP
jgi:hypothetical protein